MADNKISDLPTTAALTLSDLLEVEQPAQAAGTRSRKSPISQMLALIFDNDPALAGDSADRAATQQAVKAFVADAIADAVSAARAPVITSTITTGTITPSATTDILRALGLSATLTIANPSGSPADGAGFIAYIEDDGTTRTLSWGSKYSNSEFAALPTATTAGKRHRLGFEYHAGDDKLYCMYAEVEA